MKQFTFKFRLKLGNKPSGDDVLRMTIPANDAKEARNKLKQFVSAKVSADVVSLVDENGAEFLNDSEINRNNVILDKIINSFKDLYKT